MSELILKSIGLIRTPYHDKYSAPRQPFSEGTSTAGKIVLDSGNNFEQALSDLEGFEKIWLIYQFDRNVNWKPKVLPPRGSSIKRGVFSTRSPHRPNPIGLSLVTLVEIKARTLFIAGVDMLDKTPLFDIKPYLPNVESFPLAKSGWIGTEVEELSPGRTIEYSAEAQAYLKGIEAADRNSIHAHLERSLRYEIGSHSYKRLTRIDEDSYRLAYKQWRIRFSERTDSGIFIESIWAENL